MGRSQETFSKKEKEKKRKKKKEAKMLKREERRDNQGDGSFESMLAYVDENGHIVDTPPDPKKKKAVKASDIVLGVPSHSDEPDEPLTGKLYNFQDDKGYGFIRDSNGNDSYFVHVSSMLEEIKEGDKVGFELEKGPKGLSAVRVKKI